MSARFHVTITIFVVALAGVQPGLAAPSATNAPSASYVRNLEVLSSSATTVRIGWEGNCASYEVVYQKLARHARWQTEAGIHQHSYTIINLDPGSRYQVKVRGVPAETPAPARLPEVGVLPLRTLAADPRPFRKLALWPPAAGADKPWEGDPKTPEIELWPARPLIGLPADATCARLFRYKEALYAVACRGGGIYLWQVQLADPVGPKVTEEKGFLYVTEQRGKRTRRTKLDPPTPPSRLLEYSGSTWSLERRGPDDLYLLKVPPVDAKVSLEAPKELVAPIKDPMTEQTLPSVVVYRDRLWLTFTRQATGEPGYAVTDARQMLLSYDFATGKVSEPITLDAVKPGAGTTEGGLTVWQDTLWLLWTEVWLEGGAQRAQVVLATYAPDTGLGQPNVWDDCPSARPETPSLAIFENQPFLLFSDLAATRTRNDEEPLMCARFNGTDFQNVVTLQGLGRNRCARGAQVGDSFYVVYETDAEWILSGDLYRDIALTRVGPRGRMVETVWYGDDMKYNVLPDILAEKTGALVVNTKLNRSPGDASDPAKQLGTWMGRIEAP